MLFPGEQAEPGKPQRLSARQWNALCRMAARLENEEVNEASAGVPETAIRPSVTVLLKNTTGSDRSAGDIMEIAGATAEFPTYPRQVNKRPVIEGSLPASTSDVVAVLIDPIPAGGYGRAAVGGLACCTVNMTDAAHEFATATASSATKLTSAASGPIRIVDVSAGGTGDKDALVMLQSWGGSSTASSGVLIRVTSTTATSSTWPGNVYTNNGDGTFTVGAEIRVKLSPGTTGTTFLVGDYAGAVLNGTATVSAVVYPLYHHPGCETATIRDCVDAVDGYRTWTIAAPFEISSFTAGDPP